MPKPLAIDLFCGLGGWSEGLLAEGYECIGYDIEAHNYGTGGYPGKLILQDVTTLHGSQFKDAALIVASPPCQEYSYMAMPWSKAKAKQAAIVADVTGEARRKLTFLFDTCFRLQREAIEAAGYYIPMVVENVRGAQKWVGKADYHYGSFYLWGDVPALMPKPETRKLKTVVPVTASQSLNFNCHINEMRDSIKQGGDWFGKNCESSMSRLYGSKSIKRKIASAMIAKIPFPLSSHIARTYYPKEVERAG